MKKLILFCVSSIFLIAGMQYVEAYDYNGHVYYMTSAGTWAQAAAEAETMGGHLVSVNDEAEQIFINDLLSGSTWIGMTDEGTEVWAWVNGDPVTYLNWSSLEPNGGAIENCAVSEQAWGGLWNDLPCDRFLRGIVEIDPQSPGYVYSGSTWLSTGYVAGESGPCTDEIGDTGPDWTQLEFDDSAWVPAYSPVPVSYHPPGVSNSQLMWANGNPTQAFFRYVLPMGSQPSFADARLWADDNLEFYVNGVMVEHDRSGGAGDYPDGSEFAFRELDIAQYLVPGNNILAIRAWDGTYCNVTEHGGKAAYIEVAHESVLPDWSLVNNSPELARWSMSMAYDSDRHVVVMFGGRSFSPSTGLLSDTWEYDGNSWKQVVTPHTPPARFWHAMAYDSARQRVVMYGGGDVDAGDLQADTWEYDGTDWLKIETAHTPQALFGMSMAFDSHTNETVLFGGQSFAGLSDQTWKFDGSDWTQVITANAPPAASLTAIAFDSIRNRIVLFGTGVAGDGSATGDLTWEFDGFDWTSVDTAASPMGRWAHTMVYDSFRQRMVMFGGYGPTYPSGTALCDTWEYDGLNWTEVKSTHSPTSREQHGMAYDSAQKAVVMFGGNGGDTWKYTDELTPSEQADSILRMVEYAVEDGSLEGSGPAASADGRLGALINMIETANEMIEAEYIPEACQQLLDAQLRTDGLAPPKDFVTGPKATELEKLIQDLRDFLGC